MDEKPVSRHSILAVWCWPWWVWIVVVPLMPVVYVAAYEPALYLCQIMEVPQNRIVLNSWQVAWSPLRKMVKTFPGILDFMHWEQKLLEKTLGDLGEARRVQEDGGHGR